MELLGSIILLIAFIKHKSLEIYDLSMVKDFEYDVEKGEWHNNFLGDRALFFGTTKFRAFFSGLGEHFGSAAGFIFYESGVGMGQNLGQVLKTKESKIEAVEGLFDNAFEAG